MSLRYKIMLAFCVAATASIVFVGTVYHRHGVIQEKLKFIEQADDLYNNVLEARRYEKNLILYGGQENYLELLRYLSLADARIENFHKTGSLKSDTDRLNLGRELLAGYQRAIEQKWHGGHYDDADQASRMQELRELGRNLTTHIAGIVMNERRSVDELVEWQKSSIFISLAVFVLLSIGLIWFFFRLIFKPLTAIQKAASEIAFGQVRKIPHVGGSPEIQSLIAALNRMIEGLEEKTDQMVQREKMVALGTLTSGVAHELNNPLSNISSSTQIILEELGDNDLEFQKNLLQGIEQQVERARDIVKSLLEFAREHEFEPIPTDIRNLIESTVKLLRGHVPKNVEINVDVPIPLTAEVDRRRISQALMNLVINGFQAMSATGGTLKIGAYSRQKDEKIRIEVSDQGVGIPREYLPKIFDPFFSTKANEGGTGLGLYVTFGIIQNHHGQISVDSQPGKGARFTILLPMKQPED